MCRKNRARPIAPLIVAATFSLSATPSFAALISLTGGFTNFYTPFSYGTDSNLPGTVESYVNGQQLCPANVTGNPANDCRLDGEAYMDFATPVTSVAYKIVVDGSDWTENVVAFAPATNQTVNGFGPANKFLFGTLTFANGIWADPTVRLSYNLTATSPDPGFSGYDFEVSGVLVVQATTNSPANTPAQNADFVYLEDNPELGSVRAYELGNGAPGSNVVSVDVYGYLDSLHVAEFTNPQGGGYIDPGTALQPTPIPATAWLIAPALGLVAPWARRRKAS